MKLFIITIYSVFILIFSLNANKNRSKIKDSFGIPPIKKPIFIFAKVCMCLCWFFPLIYIFNDFSIIDMGIIVKYMSLSIISFGIFMFFLSSLNLGKDALKFGLPKDNEKTELKTRGIYRFSRNPMYLGFFLIIIGSIVFTFHPLNIFFGSVAVIVHHIIVLKEEQFLEERFKKDWIQYKREVRRYI
ncbi:MAG: isoprenylcysteine carboxylmethyltransferase family protein [Desulfobacterales bacterium]|nr:isoprenylcysteine carboxylmethyltransferase family protein [Desulfobacterales bacterium]